MPTRLHLDRNEKLIIAEHVQDVEPILEHNKQLRSMPQKSDWARHIASIPNVIWEKWMNESQEPWWLLKAKDRRILEDKILNEKLNDPDWKYLRTDK